MSQLSSLRSMITCQGRGCFFPLPPSFLPPTSAFFFTRLSHIFHHTQPTFHTQTTQPHLITSLPPCNPFLQSPSSHLPSFPSFSSYRSHPQICFQSILFSTPTKNKQKHVPFNTLTPLSLSLFSCYLIRPPLPPFPPPRPRCVPLFSPPVILFTFF